MMSPRKSEEDVMIKFCKSSGGFSLGEMTGDFEIISPRNYI